MGGDGAALYGTVLGSLVGGWPTTGWAQADAAVHRALYVLRPSVALAMGGHVSSRAFHRRHRHRHLDRGRAALHFGNRAAGVSRSARGMFQFNIVFGIVIAFLSKAVIARIGRECVALDARHRGHSIGALRQSCASASRKARAG
jgi:hypothetical protein